MKMIAVLTSLVVLPVVQDLPEVRQWVTFKGVIAASKEIIVAPVAGLAVR